MTCYKDVVRHFGTLWISDFVTTLILYCHKVAAMSLYNVATTLSTDVGETLIPNVLPTSIQRITWSCDNVVTTSLRLLRSLQIKKGKSSSHFGTEGEIKIGRNWKCVKEQKTASRRLMPFFINNIWNEWLYSIMLGGKSHNVGIASLTGLMKN